MLKKGEIPDRWMVSEICTHSSEILAGRSSKSKTIVWPVPMGVFDIQAFESGTKALAEAVVAATKAGSYSLIGGGDSAAAVNKFGFGNDVSFVSTGGGALLEHMEGKVLPGVAALEP